MKIKGPFNHLIRDYVNKHDWRVRENSNQSFSLSALNLYIANHAVKDWWLSSVYPENIARSHIDGDVHIHDIGFLSAYTYSGKEVVIARVGKSINVISFERLYEIIDEDERVIDIEHHVYAKYPSNLYVLDHNGWVRATRIIKKDKTRPMKLIAVSDGRNVIVTDNHPMVTYRGEKNAIDIDGYDNLFSENIASVLSDDGLFKVNTISVNGKEITLSRDAGVVVGCVASAEDVVLSDGAIVIRYRGGLGKSNVDVLVGSAVEFIKSSGSNINYNIFYDNNDVVVNMQSDVLFNVLLYLFGGSEVSNRLPENLMAYSREFVSGVLDGFAAVVGNHSYADALAMRTVFAQADIIDGIVHPGGSSGGWRRVAINNYIDTGYSYIYDITTETGTLIVNGLLSHNCVGWDLLDILLEGFGGVEGRIQSAPPKHFSTALMQIVNFLFTLQNEVAGAVALSDASMYLAPFIRYDHLTYNQVKQHMQEFVFNMNVATRSGGQAPFSNLTLNLTVPEYAVDQPVIIGGKPMNDGYGEFQEEIDMFNRAFAEILYEGDYRGRPFSFPIGTINVDKNFDWDSDANDVLWDVTAKTGPFYFANFISSDMDPEDVRSMCPLSSSEKVLVEQEGSLRMCNIGDVGNDGSLHTIFSDGKFVRGKFQEWDNQEAMTVVLDNGHSITMSKTHLNFAKDGIGGKIKELIGSDLRVGMYLPYSSTGYDGEFGNYDLGYIVGSFMCVGEFDNGLVFHYDQHDLVPDERGAMRNTISALKAMGAEVSTVRRDGDVRAISDDIVKHVKMFVDDSGSTRSYNPSIINTSIMFKRGVIDAYTDINSLGDGWSRISEDALEFMNILVASCGMFTSVRVQDDTILFKVGASGTNVDYFVEDGLWWVRISEIIDRGTEEKMYCFEVLGDKPMFTVATTGILTHNCHLHLDTRELKSKGGGLFGANPKTGSINVTTINLPRLAYLSHNEEEFLERLSEKMDMAVNIAEIKRGVVEDMTSRGLYPYSRRYLNSIKATGGGWWDNHFDTVGIVGMNEALLNLYGTTTADDDGIDATIRMLNFMRDRAKDLQDKYGHLVNIEATPAESVSYRLAMKDRDKFPGIRIYNQEQYGSDKRPYYTNSTQLPVDFTNDPYEVAKKQEVIQSMYTGGTVQHFYLGESLNFGIEAKTFIRKILTNFKLPYITVTPTFTVCPIHGRISGSHKYCPYCDEKLIAEARQNNKR